MDIVSITEGRKKLGELVNLVKYQKRVIALGKNGRADVLIVSLIDDEAPVTEINSASPSFDFLNEEPELYSRADLRKRYV